MINKYEKSLVVYENTTSFIISENNTSQIDLGNDHIMTIKIISFGPAIDPGIDNRPQTVTLGITYHLCADKAYFHK